MATVSPLLALPAELRNLIYDYYLAHDPDIAPPVLTRSPLALPLACRQLHNEIYTLAFAATTFRTRRWHQAELHMNLSKVRTTFRPLVRRLELTIPADGFLTDVLSLQGLRFAEAGLSNLEELFIAFTGRLQSKSREALVVSNLVVLLWNTVRLRGNQRLGKIRIVGSLHWDSLVQLNALMHKKLEFSPTRDSRLWKVLPSAGKANFKLCYEETGCPREVSVALGRTVREAELFPPR